MPELSPVRVSVVLCSASSVALDALVPPGHGARICRTAPDEVLFVSPIEFAADIARETADRVAALDDDALVLDVSDGWAAWGLKGPDARDALAYVSQVELPETGFTQGAVAHVAAKVLADGDALILLVPSYWREHVRERLVHDARTAEIAS